MLGTQTAAFPHLSCVLPPSDLWPVRVRVSPWPWSRKVHKQWLICSDGRIAVPHGSLPVSPCPSPHVLGWSKPSCHSSSWVLAPACGGQSGITSKPSCSQGQDLQLLQDSWVQLQVCYLGLVGTQKPKSVLQTLTVSFLSLWTDASSVTAAPAAAFEEIIPYLSIITVLRVLTFPKSSSCVISNTILQQGIIMHESVITDSCHLGHHSDS